MAGEIGRRSLLLALPAALVGSHVRAAPPLRSAALSNAVIAVSDMARSLPVYERLFGPSLPDGDTAIFRMARSPAFLALRKVRPEEKPGYASFGIAIQDFIPERVEAALTDLGVAGARAATHNGRSTVWFEDPDGGRVQFAAPGHIPGAVAAAARPPTQAAPFPLQTFSHVTVNARDRPRTAAFFEAIFPMPVQAMQGPGSLMRRIGPGPDFLALSNKADAPDFRPGVDHACFAVADFDVAAAIAALAKAGFQPVEVGDKALIKPMTCRARLRQFPNNGGGPSYPLGTFEVYFQDPDNTAIQLQDVSYCGGSGRQGEICP